MRRTVLLVAGAVSALAVTAAGTAGVQALITGAQIKDGTIESRDIKNGTIRRGDIGAATLSSLRGPRGGEGAQGDRGAIGPQGATGPQGSAGPQGPQGSGGATGAQGPQGVKGDIGDGIHLTGSVATVADLPATGAAGDAYLIAGDLYVWDGTQWVNGGPVQGPEGQKGDTGDPGPQGAQGPQGPIGPAGPSVSVTVHTAPFSLVAGDSGLFTVQCGAGEKAVSGGFTYVSNALVLASDTVPTSNGNGWELFLVNVDNAIDASGTVQVVCLG